MKKINKKILIAALSVMLVMCASVTLLSFTLAGNGSKKTTDSENVYAAGPVATKTNIDRIIDSSNSADPDVDKVYHIVEITSGSKSPLDTLVSSGKFENLLINGNRTIEDLMAADCIDYQSLTATQCRKNLDDALKVISKADFVYVSNDPSSQYSEANDIPQEVYALLHTTALGDYKPMIIDSPAKTAEIANTSLKTFTVLADRVFKTYGASRYTFSWVNTLSADTFFNVKDAQAYYLPMHGDTLSAKWTKIPTTAGEVDNVARILTIKSGAADMTNTNKIKSELTTAYTPAVSDTATTTDALGNVVNVADIDLSNTYVLDPTSILYTAGYKSTEVRPTAVKFDEIDINVADQKAQLSTIDLSQYDMILIEQGCAGKTLSDDQYGALSSAVYALTHILYDSKLLSGTSGGTGTTTFADTLYLDLFYMVATTKGIARTSNVLVSSRDELKMFANASSPKTYAPIVSIINSGSYRGIGGKGSSSADYTVLEIQPCYPIDSELAIQIGKRVKREGQYGKLYGEGNYYTKPSDMISDLSADEIEQDGTVEYYAWELSKAKISHVTGIPVDNITIIHMSTEEFACSKKDVVGSYDLIYVGGNTSALKNTTQYAYGLGADRIWDAYRSQIETVVPSYSMYYHNGDWYTLSAGPVNSGGSPVKGTSLIGQVSLDDGKTFKTSFGLEGGNDITVSKLNELKEYIGSGLPIVFSKTVCDSYEETIGVNAYDLHDIDPDSNMYKLLTYAYNANEKNQQNILWGFDNSLTTKAENVDGKYGDKITSGYATVFAGLVGDPDVLDGDGNAVREAQKLADLITLNLQRPKLALTSCPVTYNYLNPEETTLENGDLTFKYEVEGNSTSYVYTLYIDDNGDSTFSAEDGENVKTLSGGSTGTFTHSLSSSFYGPVYWKFEVADASNGKVCAFKTGVSKIPNKTDEKQKVSVLQIMPDISANTGVPGSVNNTSLLLCPECQQAYGILKGNPFADTERGSIAYYYAGNYEDWTKNVGKMGYLPKICENGLGIHEHKLGIVYYDKNMTIGTTKGVDDWDYNLADIVKPDYDFSIDIVTTTEYEAMCKEVQAEYNLSAADIARLIREFKIDESDEMYEEYQNMTDEEKGKFIVSRQNAEKAGDYWQLYNFMVNSSVTDGATTGINSKVVDDEISKIEITTKQADADMQACLDKMIANLTTNNANQVFGKSQAYIRSELQRLKDTKKYYDYYSIGTARYNQYSYNILGKDAKGNNITYEDYFIPWVKAKDKELEFYKNYMKYLRLSKPSDEWIETCYSAVVLGAAEDYGGDDINDMGTRDLKSYIEHDNTLLLFHDTISKYADAGSVNLTNDLAEVLGMDKYHLELNASDSGISFIDTLVNTKVSGKIDGYDYNVTVPSSAETATLVATQKGTLKTNPYTVTLDAKGQIATGTLASTTKSVTYKITKASALKEHIGIALHNLSWDGDTPNSYNLVASAALTGNTKSVTIEVDYQYGSPKGYRVTNVVTGDGSFGDVTITFKFNNIIWDGSVQGEDTGSNPYIYIDGVRTGRVHSSDVVTVPNNEITYTTAPVETENGLTGFGVQSVNVEVVDADGNGIGAEKGTITVDGTNYPYSTSSDGKATVEVYNYNTTGITLSPLATTGNTTDSIEQTFEIKYVDINGDPVKNKSVTMAIAGAETFNENQMTNGSGVASATFKNYTRTSSSGGRNYYLNYSTRANYDPNTYFQSTLKKSASLPKSAWGDAYYNATGADYGRYLTNTALTTFIAIGQGDGDTNAGALMYKYADVAWAQAAYWNMAASSKDSRGTNRATQNNIGIITSYPFQIADRLNISDTHPQSLELDVEDRNMTVWYSLAGGTGGKGGSSLFAASPNDGVDNYFIYSFGNVFYCGAGHSKVTGIGKENNDERLLYINILCNSVRKSAKMPAINVYDHNAGETLGTFIKVDATGQYYCKVDDMYAIPEFAYKCITDQGADISNVKIYYDLDYSSDNLTSAYKDDDNHKLIFESNYDYDNNVATGLLKQIDVSVAIKSTVNGAVKSALQLQPSYFEPYNQEYTYIVIAVTDTKGNIVYQRIKVLVKQYLHDLT